MESYITKQPRITDIYMYIHFNYQLDFNSYTTNILSVKYKVANFLYIVIIDRFYVMYLDIT